MTEIQLANLTLSFLDRCTYTGTEFNDFKLVVEWLQGKVLEKENK